MTLTDAGPLIALLDRSDPDHDQCRTVLPELPQPLVTTWPTFTEAMHMVRRVGGDAGSDALWRLVLTDRLVLADLVRSSVERAAELMQVYADRTMDLGDATLVALAEERGVRTIFSLDSDFDIYRMHRNQRFHRVPR